MSTIKDAEGPYIVWENLGYDGWHPYSFKTLKEALEKQKFSSEWVIAKLVVYEIIENDA